MSACDICDELAAIKATLADHGDKLSILLTGVGTLVAASSQYWNPSDKAAGIALTNSNKTAQSSVTDDSVRNVTAHNGGKFSYEVVNAGAVGSMIGIANASKSLSGPPVGYDANSVGVFFGIAYCLVRENDSSIASIFIGFEVGDVLHLDWDLTSKKLYIAKNGSYLSGHNPVAGTGGISFSLSGPVYCAGTPFDASAQMTLRSVATDMSAIPSGFTAWG